MINIFTDVQKRTTWFIKYSFRLTFATIADSKEKKSSESIIYEKSFAMNWLDCSEISIKRYQAVLLHKT